MTVIEGANRTPTSARGFEKSRVMPGRRMRLMEAEVRENPQAQDLFDPEAADRVVADPDTRQASASIVSSMPEEPAKVKMANQGSRWSFRVP